MKGIHRELHSSNTSIKKCTNGYYFPASDSEGEDSHDVPDVSSDQSDQSNDDTVPDNVRCVNCAVIVKYECVCV